MFSYVNRKRIAAFKVLKFENVLHFSLEKYCRFQKDFVPLPMIKDIISENGLHLGITSELDSALGFLRPYGNKRPKVERHRPCSIEIKNYKLLNF